MQNKSMKDLLPYKIMLVWNSKDLPESFTHRHNTQRDTWAKLTILRGSLTFALMTEAGDVTETLVFTPHSQTPFAEPQQWHRIVSFSDDMQCQLTFYCSAENYVHKKYQLTATHSDVVEAVRVVAPGQALDLGCGSGRNALYLGLKGFNVTAWDKNQESIERLTSLIQEEKLSAAITAEVKDLNSVVIDNTYDFILSTVVLMFLNRERIPSLIANMQACTAPGGYNLIVAAMDSHDYPCSLPFPFTFKAGELKDYYQGWNIIKYNEGVGQLHKTDANGERIKLRFATLLACKNA